MISWRSMKPCGSSPRYGNPGSWHCQFGVTRQNESQRSVRQACPARAFSSTTWPTPRFAKCQLIERPAWPAPTTMTEWCSTRGVITRTPTSFFERVHRHACGGIADEGDGRVLEAGELIQGALAGPTVFCLHPLARQHERGVAESEEFVQRIALARSKEVLDHQRGRIACFRRAVGPADAKTHFRHGRAQ